MKVGERVSAERCSLSRPWYGSVDVVENVQIARDTYRVRLGCPEIARRIVPGQFLMLRLAGFDDPLLGRPFALYDSVQSGSGATDALDVVYLVAGKLTSRLSRFLPGQRVDVWGPLGNGFCIPETEHLIMVAGGIGQTPFLALAQECLGGRTYGNPARAIPRVPRMTFCYGARADGFLAGVSDFQRLGIDVRLSTDDGSAGHHGLVTDLLPDLLAEPRHPNGTRIVCCGPERMMEAAAGIARQAKVPCQLSLETPMACGLGICFSCVARIRDPNGVVDYRRTCVEGPVFDAECVVF